ncbi:MAG: hypothetical protein Q7S57_03820 [bacterium]|nr:hypothetical protein [bacterium]
MSILELVCLCVSLVSFLVGLLGVAVCLSLWKESKDARLQLILMILMTLSGFSTFVVVREEYDRGHHDPVQQEIERTEAVTPPLISPGTVVPN